MGKEQKELKKARANYIRSLLLALGMGAFYILAWILLPDPPQDGGLKAMQAFSESEKYAFREQLLGFRAGAATGGVILCIVLGGYYTWLLCSPKRCLKKYRKNYDERQKSVRERAGYLTLMTVLLLLIGAFLVATMYNWFVSIVLLCVLYAVTLLYGIFYFIIRLIS